jgi:hypothetical protein
MKKLAGVLAGVLSGVVFGQNQTGLDPGTQSYLDDAMTEFVEWYKTTNSFKVGGHDMAVVGLLENIFFNESVKHMYGKINPDITKLAINANHPEDLLKTCTYDKWLNSISVLDSSQYYVNYYYLERFLVNGKMIGTEYLTITNKETNESRFITIHYYEYALRSIIDDKRSLYK